MCSDHRRLRITIGNGVTVKTGVVGTLRIGCIFADHKPKIRGRPTARPTSYVLCRVSLLNFSSEVSSSKTTTYVFDDALSIGGGGFC